MKENSVKLNKAKNEVIINNLTIKNPDVISFLEDKKDLEKWVEKSIIIGCVGLKQMTLSENVDFIEKSFNKFLVDAKKSFQEQSNYIEEKLEEFFDDNKSDSMISNFKKFLEEHEGQFDLNNKTSLMSKFKEFIESQQEDMTESFDNTFSLDNKKSSLYKFQNNLDKIFDMKQEGSPLNQFKNVIEEYFNVKNGKLKESMKEYFDEKDGKVKALLDKSFDIDNKNSSFSKLLASIKDSTELEEDTIKDLLNPNKADSPIQLLKADILKQIKDLKESEIKDIRDAVLKEQAIDEEKARGTKKGLDFEEGVYETLEKISSVYEDKVEKTTGTYASSGKVGDIIVDLDGSAKKRIVIECKNSKGYGVKKTLDETNLALKNRNAKFCIFLFAEKEQMPSAFYPIKITDSYIITYYGTDNLYFAYRLARILLVKDEKKDESTIDFDKISKEIALIEDRFRSFDEMKSKATSIINSGTYISDNLTKVKYDLESSFHKIKSLLGNKITEQSVEEAEETESNIVTDGIVVEPFTGSGTISAQILSAKHQSNEKTCLICGRTFVSGSKVKKWCSYDCRETMTRIKTAKTLTLEEKEIKDRLTREGVL